MPGARAIGREARWQASTLLLVTGPVLGVFGWAAAFTLVGAVAIFAGMGASALGWVIRPTRWTFGFALVGLFVEFGWVVLASALDRLS